MKADDTKEEEHGTCAEGIGEFPVVVWKDNTSKAIGAYACQSKGDNEYATRRGAQDMTHLLGYNRMSFEGDQEPALRVLMKNVKTISEGQCMLLELYVGDTQNSGDAESAV